MRFAVKDHLYEAQALVQALTAAGHEEDPNGPTDLFLVDLDPDQFEHRPMIDFYREQGAVVLQYPHGAPASTLQYDNLYEPYEGIDGQLCNGQGEIDFLRSIGVGRPAKTFGWQLCRQYPFRATEQPKRVVFAPTHDNADGGLDRSRTRENARIFRELLKGPWDLVVRAVGDLERIGLWHDERVFRYVRGARDMSTVEIDVADCVVAGVGTYPCLAVARGVPTIMYSQFQAAMYGFPDEQPKPLRNLAKYRDLVRYPLDAEDGDLTRLIYRACASDEPIRAWRDAWIGRPFDGPAFVRMVEAWIPELRAARAVAVQA